MPAGHARQPLLPLTSFTPDAPPVLAARSGAKSVKEWLQKAKLKEAEVRKGLRADLLTTKTIDALMGHAKLTGDGAAQK